MLELGRKRAEKKEKKKKKRFNPNREKTSEIKERRLRLPIELKIMNARDPVRKFGEMVNRGEYSYTHTPEGSDNPIQGVPALWNYYNQPTEFFYLKDGKITLAPTEWTWVPVRRANALDDAGDGVLVAAFVDLAVK